MNNPQRNPKRNAILLTAAIAVVAGGLALALSQSDQVKSLIRNETTTQQTETTAETPVAVTETTDEVATTAANTAATTETAIETAQDAAQQAQDTTQETAANEGNMTPIDLNTQTPAAGEEEKAEAKASDVKVDVAKALEDRSMGSKDAKVTVYDYSSLTCPHCAMFHNEILPKIKENYIDTGKVRWVFKGFPLNEPALKAEMLARCAPDDQYIKLIDMMYKEQARWAFSDAPMPTLSIMVRIAGISQELFDACTTNSELQAGMIKKSEEASRKYKIESTPTFVFNDGEKTFSGAGSYTGFAYDLDEALKQDPAKKATTENKEEFMPPATEENSSKKAEETFTHKK